MFIIPSIDLSMKLSLSEVFVSNIIVTMVISNKSCCKHVLFTNLSDFISTTTRVTSLKSKKFLFCSFSMAKFGIALSISDWLLLFTNCQRVTWTAYAIFAMCSDDYTCVCIPIEKSFQKVTVKVSFTFNCFAFPSSKLNILSAAAFQMLPFVSS